MNKKDVILITGASSGMGRETAIRLAKQSYIVYAAARRIDKLNELKEFGCIPIQLDITNEQDIEHAVSTIEKAHGGIDVLFNNAGVATLGSLEETAIEDAKKLFEVNLFGLAHLTQLVIPSMRKKGAGKIINTSSIAGKVHGPLSSWYVASKHALEGLSSSLRVELKPFGIDVVIIRPGVVSTGLIGTYVDPMINQPENGSYAEMTKVIADWSKSRDNNPKYSSPPSVIADTVLKIIKSKNPKTAYEAGKTSSQMIWSRKLLSDKTLDKMMLRFLKS
ncbi:oxidoreductase [Maribacter sp. ACAM166]|uniref:oxidoreductase n=1 Tax=Maribacter sp. ACAM166 TaxID=2508996 RepID=UPI0010FDE2B8|nr:oxidoreductase [Maribacter sp. ACAM166]TLP75638.1 SDR family NAD(P)-dependent oxidoreductase [Maribacter sp. ACAM166]